MRSLKGLVLVASLVAAGSASAQRKVVALPPEMKPAPPTALLERFHAAAVRGAAEGFTAVPAADVRARVTTGSCHGGPCLGPIAEAFSADLVLATTIEQSGKEYTVKAKLFDANGREVGKGAEEHCDICTVREADETVERAAHKALQGAPAAAATAPTALPRSSSRVSDEDSEREPAPPPRPIKTPGSSENEAPPAYHNPAQPPPSTIPVSPPPEAAPAPAPKPAETPAAEGSKIPYRVLAGASFGVAGASLIGTIVFASFAARESQPTCNLPDPKHSCPQIYSGNGGPTAVFAVLTGLTAGAGALFLYLDHRARHASPSVAVAPLPGGGAAAAASFSF